MSQLLHIRLRTHSLLLLLICLCLSFESLACNLVMGYRTNDRQPLIARAPDSSGLYKELYTKAASKIGCTLEVIRLPKKRILRLLQQGAIDFYPGFDFTLARSKYIYYIFNGLPGGHVGISRLNFPEITHVDQLNNKVLLLAQGGSDLLSNLTVNVQKVKIKQPPEINLTQAVAMLKNHEADFYIYDIASISYYLKLNNEKQIKVHEKCCKGIKPMYLGFSKKSKHILLTKKINYDPQLSTSINNYPQELSGGSIAERFQQVLKEMHFEGEIKQIYKKYYQ